MLPRTNMNIAIMKITEDIVEIMPHNVDCIVVEVFDVDCADAIGSTARYTRTRTAEANAMVRFPIFSFSDIISSHILDMNSYIFRNIILPISQGFVFLYLVRLKEI